MNVTRDEAKKLVQNFLKYNAHINGCEVLRVTLPTKCTCGLSEAVVWTNKNFITGSVY